MTAALRILAVTFDGAGNFPPERALFRALTTRGHKVTVLAHDTQRAAIEADGAAFHPFAHAPQRSAISPTSVADELAVHDDPFSWDLTENCAFASRFSYTSE